MGSDLSYKIVKKDYVIPKKEVFENEKEYWKAYNKHLEDFESLDYCRNSWESLSGFYNMYSRHFMINVLKSYLDEIENSSSDFISDTLRAFGEIISCMGKDDFVIIHYC